MHVNFYLHECFLILLVGTSLKGNIAKAAAISKAARKSTSLYQPLIKAIC